MGKNDVLEKLLPAETLKKTNVFFGIIGCLYITKHFLFLYKYVDEKVRKLLEEIRPHILKNKYRP